MIFDDEIEEIGGFLGEGGVEVLAGETLVDGTEDGFETVAAEAAEHFSGAERGAELVDEADASAGVENGAGLGLVAETDETGVVFAESAEGVGIAGDEGDGAVGVVAGEVVLSHQAANDTESVADFEKSGLGKFGEAGFVEGEAGGNVFMENIGSPDAEIGGFAGVDAVGDGDDGVEIVGFDSAADGAVPFYGNL